MNINIKVACAYFTPEGVVADSVAKPKFADYNVVSDNTTYCLFASSVFAPAGVTARIPLDASDIDAVFMNGFQSATDSREKSLTEKLGSVSYAGYAFDEIFGSSCPIKKYKNKPGVTYGFSYCYFRCGDKIKLFASLDESQGYTVFRYDASKSALVIKKDIEGVNCFDNYKALSLFYAEGEENEVFDAWFAKLPKNDNPPALGLIGYSTKKLDLINESVIDYKLSAVKGCFPVKPNIYIIDGDYCLAGDWMAPCEERFPKGLRPFSDMIKEAGLMSGLRISPFTVSADSYVYEEHKDWLLKTRSGRTVKTGYGDFVLDTENEEVKVYVREVLHTVLYMWGFDLVKLDDLYVAGIVPAHGKSRGETMCNAMRFLRECCGGKLMYADDAPLMPAFGIADYCAICGSSVSNVLPEAYTRRFYRESLSVRNASANIVFRRGLNKRAFMSAPCYITLDDKKSFYDGRLNYAEQNVLTNLEGLFTSVAIVNDTGAAYEQKKKRRFKKMCELEEAEDVKVKRVSDGFYVTYKFKGKSYIVKFK